MHRAQPPISIRMSFRCSILYALCLVFLLLPEVGLADSVHGTLDFNYSSITTKTTDATGNDTKTDSTTHNPRFTLNIDKTIYPNLRLIAGGMGERIVTDSETNGEDTKTTLTRIRPFLDLRLHTPFYTAGVGYSRREETIKTSGVPSTTDVNEEYNAILGWRPAGFPSWEMRYRRTNNFDEDRSVQDINQDFYSLISKYEYKGLTIDYLGTYTETKDNIIHFTTEDLLHSARLSYGGTFINDRLSLYSTYNYTHQEVKTTAAGSGFVSLQIFPVQGLFSLDDTPTDGPPLDPAPALIDGNVLVSTGVNIGVPSLGGDSRPRNIGLDFGITTEVSQLFVWVDRELPTGISDSFSWQIYTSPDNATWTLSTTVNPAVFNSFQNRFEIDFPNVTTRFIKVVVDPLTAAEAALVPTFLNPDAIHVTELQAFSRKAARELEGSVRRTSQIYNLDTKTRILDLPALYYDLTYYLNKVDPSGQKETTLSNGFSLIHRFSTIFSTTAKVAREEGKERDENRVAYIFNSAVNADFLRTLRSSLVLSGRDEEIGGRPSHTYSVILNNTAELYKGVDINLNGGMTFAKDETGERQRTTLFNFLSTITPRRDLTLNLNYSDTIARRSGGERESDTEQTQRGEVTVSYYPFRTLNLFGRIEIITQTHEDTRTTKDYGLNWAPFPDGALQLSFIFDEELRSEDNGLNRIIAPTLRWNMTKRSYVDLTYQMIKSESNQQKTDSKVISTNLKVFF
ncbi:MAG: hypothetical protein ACE144_07775 [Thermodesulfobacteriota bacterium]